jgi:hypothetical protein
VKRKHECRTAVLNAIDGSSKRAEEPSPLADYQNRPVGGKIDDGFLMMAMKEDDIEEDDIEDD